MLFGLSVELVHTNLRDPEFYVKNNTSILQIIKGDENEFATQIKVFYLWIIIIHEQPHSKPKEVVNK